VVHHPPHARLWIPDARPSPGRTLQSGLQKILGELPVGGQPVGHAEPRRRARLAELQELPPIRGILLAANMSAGHLSREFRLACGESPYAYLMSSRDGGDACVANR
jgi:hypothetical protein